jgi:hypothetical protein
MQPSAMSVYTNVFVDTVTGQERDCGHDHDDEIDALACCLAQRRDKDAVITYRDDDHGRWQYLGRWALVDRREA